MKPALLALLMTATAALSGCMSDPRLNAGVSIGTGGVHVYPSISGRIGGARVAVSP